MRRRHDDLHFPMQGRGKRAPRKGGGSERLVLDAVKATDLCPCHPAEVDRAAANYPGTAIAPATHECMATEMRCVYCGVRLQPHPCNGCGKFLNTKHMHEAGQGESWRCEECRGF